MFILVGDPGKKNGEKKLRALLSRCAEWHSDAVRLALAARLEPAPKHARLVSALRGSEGMASLRKADLLTLAREWRYRWQHWQQRRVCSRNTQRMLAAGVKLPAAPAARAAAAAAAVAPPEAAPPAWSSLHPFGRCGAHEGLTEAHVRLYLAELRPLIAPIAVLYEGRAAQAAAQAHCIDHLTTEAVIEMQKSADSKRNILATCDATLAFVASLGDSPPMDEPAWRALAGRQSSVPLLQLINSLRDIYDRLFADIARQRVANRGRRAALAWCEEMHRGRGAVLEMLMKMHFLITMAAFAPLRVYLCALEALRLFIHETMEALTQGLLVRLRWVRALVDAAREPEASPALPSEDADVEEKDAAETLLYVCPFAQGGNAACK